MKSYYVNIPQFTHALTIAGRNEKEARKNLRDREGFGDRLPNGTKFYQK